MNLSVSNIAWRPEERHDAYALLKRHGVRGLEIAPGLLYGDDIGPAARYRVAGELRDAGLTLVSMQSLLFGQPDAQLFGDAPQRDRFRTAIMNRIDLARALGIPVLVFGSPRNRSVPDGMAPDHAWESACAMFRALGAHAQAAGCVLSIEPVPVREGTNFLNDTRTTLRFVRETDHPGLGLTIDTGAMAAGGEISNAGTLLQDAAPHIVHYHLSSPGLGPVPHDPDALRTVMDHGRGRKDRWQSIEMRRGDDPMGRLEAALVFTTSIATTWDR